VDELMHRQQLDGSHTKPEQVVGDRRLRQATVGAAQLMGHLSVAHRVALDVQLVDHRVDQRGVRPPLAAPVKSVATDD
jgi:hypothetical protein